MLVLPLYLSNDNDGMYFLANDDIAFHDNILNFDDDDDDVNDAIINNNNNIK